MLNACSDIVPKRSEGVSTVSLSQTRNPTKGKSHSRPWNEDVDCAGETSDSGLAMLSAHENEVVSKRLRRSQPLAPSSAPFSYTNFMERRLLDLPCSPFELVCVVSRCCCQVVRPRMADASREFTHSSGSARFLQDSVSTVPFRRV